MAMRCYSTDGLDLWNKTIQTNISFFLDFILVYDRYDILMLKT